MSIPKFNPRGIVLFLIIIAVGLLRIAAATSKNISPISNFTPIAAMALFGGAYFSNNLKAFGWPLLTLWLSDILLNKLVFYGEWRLFYEGFYWTYGAFALMSLVGKYFIKDATVKNILSATLISVLIHWIVTDFGVWVDGTMYAKTFTGFIECLVAAIPYELRLMTGTLVYGTIMFGLFEWMQKKIPSLKMV